MANPVQVAAVDLGATSGRVVIGSLSDERVTLETVERFANGVVHDGLHLRWDLSGLYRKVLRGLATGVGEHPGLRSVGVDSWAVDYGLILDGSLAVEPFHYRDERNGSGVVEVNELITPADLYRRNGLQFLPFNTLYQLAAERLGAGFAGVDAMLLIPDLVNYWLSDAQVCERTNASTTGLLAIADAEWDTGLIDRLELPSRIFPKLVSAGSIIGQTNARTNASIGLPAGLDVVAVGSHDTASAVVATPMDPSRAAYISCGTWGLVGVELDEPVLTENARLAGFTNESGVGGKVRFLHNVMGLWLLSETIREWEAADGLPLNIERLLAEAAAQTPTASIFDVNDGRFLSAGHMVGRIAAQCEAQGLPVPRSRGDVVRSIVESLAQAFAEAVDRAGSLSGIPIEQVHIVGGGSLNALLCQSIATRLGMPLVAGPVEATALGNVLIQMRAIGSLHGSLGDMRSMVSNSFATTTYFPKPK